MAVVVSDTSPVVALAYLGHLDLLTKFFGQVLIPPAVADELSKPAWREIAGSALTATFLQIRAPTDRGQVARLTSDLDPGEAEAFALALEIRAEAILIDESEGRAMAAALGIATVGVLGLILRAKREKRIEAVAPMLDALQSGLGFHVGPELRRRVLEDAGE